jgi:hypothetical protein
MIKRVSVTAIVSTMIVGCSGYEVESTQQNLEDIRRSTQSQTVAQMAADGELQKNKNACLNGLTFHSAQVAESTFDTAIVDLSEGGSSDGYIRDQFDGESLNITRCDLSVAAADKAALARLINEADTCYAIPIVDDNFEPTGEYFDGAGFLLGGENSQIDSLIQRVNANRSNCNTESHDLGLPGN